MERIPEPELMDEPEQAQAYANADFSEPHDHFIELFRERFGTVAGVEVLDLGCGPGDICRRFSRAFPDCTIAGVDGSPTMLELARAATRTDPQYHRVTYRLARLPEASLPRQRFGIIISNSLLHHLGDPSVLWSSITRCGQAGSIVFVMDLFRPPSVAAAQQLVDTYAADEPEVLKNDFLNSLLAAYQPDEVRAQLSRHELGHLQIEIVSDRHLLVFGRL